MNILFICDEYPPGKNGGIGSAVQSLARQLAAMQHQVFVAGLYSYRYGQPNVENDQGVNVHRRRYGLKLPVSGDSRWYNLLEKLPAPARSILNGKKAFQRFIAFIHQLVEREKIDVIEIADYNNFCTHIGFVVQWPVFKAPLLLKYHGSHTYLCQELGISPDTSLEKTDRKLFLRADAHSSVSNYTAARSAAIFSVKVPVKVLYNGLSIPENISRQRSHTTVVFTGSLVKNKGIYELMQAWNLVYQTFPQAQLLVLGKGKPGAAQQLLSDAARSSVEFRGHVTKDILIQTLEKATLAVFPSHSETFGLGAVEAMSTGCPIIYTGLSSGPEIITDGKDGLLVDPKNIDELATKIKMLLENEVLRAELGQAGFNTAKARFDIKVIAARHESYYQQIKISAAIKK